VGVPVYRYWTRSGSAPPSATALETS
jgi:hypothetical protein